MQKLIVYIYIRHHLNSIIISCKDDTESRHSNCISNFHYYFSSKKVWKKNQTNSNLTSQRIPLQCRKKLSVFETSGLPTLMRRRFHLMRRRREMFDGRSFLMLSNFSCSALIESKHLVHKYPDSYCLPDSYSFCGYKLIDLYDNTVNECCRDTYTHDVTAVTNVPRTNVIKRSHFSRSGDVIHPAAVWARDLINTLYNQRLSLIQLNRGELCRRS